MGEQPGPIEDEVERALVSMRAGFLSGASQIVAEIGSLQEHLAGAPDRERDSVGAAIRQIVNVQARLTAQMETLPAAAWDRFKAMVNIVKAQQSVLDQLGNLMQKHVLPRQLKNLSRSPLPGLASLYSPELEDSGYDEPIPEPEPQDETLLRANAALQALDGGLNSTAQTPTARNSPDRFEDEEEEARSLFARARQRMAGSLGLAVMAIAAVAIAAGARIMMQRGVKLEDVAAKVVAIVSEAIDAVPLAAHKETSTVATRPQAPQATVAASRPPDEPVRSDKGEEPSLAAAPEPPDPTPPPRTGSAAPTDVAPVSGPAEPPAPAQSDEWQLSVAPAAAVAPPAAAGKEQFAPVVFTDKNYQKVQQTLSDLKQRFPNLLTGRRGEVQPVDLGRKGIWYRLVLVPAGTRPKASQFCDRMQAKGYDGCRVELYQRGVGRRGS